jgi:hypothetical protein
LLSGSCCNEDRTHLSKCGKTPDKISEHPASSGRGLLSSDEDGINATICVYRCECGTMFSRTEQEDKPGTML